MIVVKRALISVSDKTGLLDFAAGLQELGIEIVSTGGTAAYVRQAGIIARQISDLTGMPEMFDGRVKTLHPAVHAALLCRRDLPEHMRQAQEQHIDLIDMVVVNLYPFAQTVSNPDVSRQEAVEQIDIGGPAMLRSAAKNAGQVVVVCRPQDYPELLAQLRRGGVSRETAFRLAAEVFNHTAAYDAAIAAYLRGQEPAAADLLPEQLTLSWQKVQTLRYGENPHQAAALYRQIPDAPGSVVNARQLHGKELSFNNLLDLNAAWQIVREFSTPAACIVKHNNPCGAAAAPDLASAFEQALNCDRLSAFGGIVGVNRSLDVQAARALLAADFLECVIAPGYAEEALTILRQKKNVRLLCVSDAPAKKPAALDFKRIDGGLLAQTLDNAGLEAIALRRVTRQDINDAQRASLLFAWQLVKPVKSNAIVLAAGTASVGIGCGQTSRVDSVRQAIEKAGDRARGAVMASDAFFPHPDSIEAAAKAGISAIIQPGGSVRDEAVIAAADSAGIAMVFTGIRHFKH